MTRARSDAWRSERYTERARETAYVTRAISDYFGSAAGRRDYRVEWKPIAGTIAATMIKDRVVRLSPSLLSRCARAPFAGADVDRMAGCAAHESGHVMLHDARQSFGRRNPASNCDSGHGRMIANIIEDIAIDGAMMMRENRTLGELTAELRRDMRPESEAGIVGAWIAPAERLNGIAIQLPAAAILNLWGCARLFGIALPATGARSQLEWDFIAAADAIAATMIATATIPGATGLTDLIAADAIDDAIIALDKLVSTYDARRAADKSAAESASPESAPESESGESGDSDADAADDDDDGDSDADSGASATNAPDMDGNAGTPDTGDSGADSADSDSDDDVWDARPDGDGDGDTADGDADDGESGDGDSAADSNGPGGSLSPDASADALADAIPDACPNHDTDDGDADGDSGDDAFWRAVARESAAMEAQRPRTSGKLSLSPYVDRRIVAAIRASYDRLASEPDRSRREESGRIDRRQLAAAVAGTRDDVFARMGDARVGGALVLVLDFSSSTSLQTGLIKRAAASLYQALAGTDVAVTIYGYGGEIGAIRIADPRRVSPDFEVIGSNGGTPTGEAIDAARIGTRITSGQNVMIHVTDGQPDSIGFAIDAMRRARLAGWKLINVRVGSGANLVSAGVSDECAADVSLRDYRELPRIMEAAVTDIVRGARRGR